MGPVQVITRPLFAVASAAPLSRAFTVTYVTLWTVAVVTISVGGVLAGGQPPKALEIAATIVPLLFKLGIMYGSIARALMTIRRIDDPLERAGLRRFVLLQLGGLIAFELAVCDVTSIVGPHTPDVVISLVPVGGAYPAADLAWDLPAPPRGRQAGRARFRRT